MIYVLSGGAKAFAVIGVTYPAGSTCTCSDGTKTLKLKDTGGQGFFLIPYAATWTVSCTDGTNTKAQSVEITSEGQSENVSLSYVINIMLNGVHDTTLIGGWVKGSSATLVSSIASTSDSLKISTERSLYGETERNYLVRSKNFLDLTSKKTITFIGHTPYVNAVVAKVCVCDSNENIVAIDGIFRGGYQDEQDWSATLDISNLTGTYYLGILLYSGNESMTASVLKYVIE